MKTIVLDASNWKSRDDFYDALMPALRAPAWHGRNLDALDESIRFDMNIELKQPYHIEIKGSSHAPEDLRIYLAKFGAIIEMARVLYLRDVAISFDERRQQGG